MLKKSSFVVVLVSVAFIGIIKENAAGVTENNTQAQFPIENAADGTENNTQTQIPSNKESSAMEKDDYKQKPSGTFAVNQYEPFMVVTSVMGISPQLPDAMPDTLPLSIAYHLPSKLIKIKEEWSLASDLKLGEPFEIPLCPELKTSNSRANFILETLHDIYPESYDCLFVRRFEDNEKQMCEREPRPSLTPSKHHDGSPVICGVSNYQQLVNAQYYNCGTDKFLEEYAKKVAEMLNENAKKEPHFAPLAHLIYEICYDFRHKKTLWTRHTPMTPQLLAHPESPYKNLPNKILLDDFSTDTSNLDLNSSTFFNLRKSYESTDNKMSTIYPLVPKQHMALLYWKKATDHMINSAPLSPEFIPLMEAINDGILKASYNLLIKSQRTLQIYTQAETKILTMLNFATHTNLPFFKSAASYLRSDAPVNLFKPNTWFQFVHDERERSGVLIVLHNTREKLPEQKECEIKERLPCDFESWSNSAETFSDDVLSHAYCCKVSQERVKSLFSIKELQLEKAFYIQEIIDEVPTEPVEPESNHQ